MPTVQEGKPINVVTKTPSVPHSNFTLTKQLAHTPKFGVNNLFFATDLVADDHFKIRPRCQTRSYTLKAPLLGDIKKHVAFYQVPLQAILPLNYEKIIVNASHGTDVQGDSSDVTNIVPALDGVNCVVSDFAKRITYAFRHDFESFWSDVDVAHTDADYGSYLRSVLLFIARWEMFFSNGSLLAHSGVHYAHLAKINRYNKAETPVLLGTVSFDSFCQSLLSTVTNLKFSITDDDGTSSITGRGIGFLRSALDFIRSHSGPFVITFLSVEGGSPSWIDSNNTYSPVGYEIEESEPLNYGRCVAYQLVNAHYYSNDKIDYVYTAELYRQYIGSLIESILSFDGASYSHYIFSYNGITCFYDYLSGFFLNEVLTYSLNTSIYPYSDNDFWSYFYPYFNAIFGFNYSLRFLDYFSGARPRNLAIGDTSIKVNPDNTVNVVDTTKMLVYQRFYNAVGRTGQSIEDYSKKILGTAIAPDWHNPKYLFSYDESIYSQETENTGDYQFNTSYPNSVTSVLRGQSGGYEFEVSIDRYSYLIGIEYFDVKRFYFTTQDKQTMAVDRFDLFIPGLQYIGDQSLKLSELIAGRTKDVPFGYQLRDMQWKQVFDECTGGFVENLPGWLFKFNPEEFTARQSNSLVISPEFIRSKPQEIDDFYLSLTGATLASYFHFIEVWTIEIEASRPMIYAPELL